MHLCSHKTPHFIRVEAVSCGCTCLRPNAFFLSQDTLNAGFSSLFFFFFIFSKIQFFYLGFSHTRCLASWILTHVWARGLSLRKLSMRLLLQVPAKKKNNWNKNYLLALLFDPICWRARGTMHFWFTHSSTADRIVTVMARYANMLH